MAYELLGPGALQFLAGGAHNTNHMAMAVVIDPDPYGRSPSLDELRSLVESRLALVPRFRRVLVPVPFRLSGPLLADDQRFDLDNHLREGATPAPLDLDGLRAWVGEYLTDPLDLTRPLWEFVRLEMVGGGAALVGKVHHSILDGVMGISALGLLLLDTKPGSAPEAAMTTWDAEPLPGYGDRVAAGLAYRVGRARYRAGELGHAVTSLSILETAATRVAELPTVIREELMPTAPRLPLNTGVGPRREVEWVTLGLGEIKEIARAFGEHLTVNDVVLDLLGTGIGVWLEHRDLPARDVRVKVPISAQLREGESGTYDKKLEYMIVDIPLGDLSPEARLQAIHDQTLVLKAEAADVVADIMGAAMLLPLPAFAWVSDRLASPREFNVAMSNVQGPSGPIFVLGSPVRAAYAMSRLRAGHALRPAVVSLGDTLTFGLTGDPDAIPDLDVLAHGIEAAYQRLSADAAAV